jgi:hypothetical protein
MSAFYPIRTSECATFLSPPDGLVWVWTKFPGIEFCAAVIDSSGASQMQETDRQNYSRRGNEERKRYQSAATSDSRSIHGMLADLCHERAHGSTYANNRTGIDPKSGTGERGIAFARMMEGELVPSGSNRPPV